MSMWKLFVSTTIASIMLTAHAAEQSQNRPIDGIGLDRTRVVIKDGSTTGTFGLINDIGVPVVVTAWVNELDGRIADAFVVTPSLYQLGNGKTGQGMIRLVSELPQDRESVFWLVVNTAASGEAQSNQLFAALGSQIKVFYRPKDLKGDTKYAAKHLDLKYENTRLKVSNPTGLSVYVRSVTFNGHEHPIGELVMPFTSQYWPISKDILVADDPVFTFIDEYGGANKQSFTLKGK